MRDEYWEPVPRSLLRPGQRVRIRWSSIVVWGEGRIGHVETETRNVYEREFTPTTLNRKANT